MSLMRSPCVRKTVPSSTPPSDVPIITRKGEAVVRRCEMKTGQRSQVVRLRSQHGLTVNSQQLRRLRVPQRMQRDWSF